MTQKQYSIMFLLVMMGALVFFGCRRPEEETVIEPTPSVQEDEELEAPVAEEELVAVSAYATAEATAVALPADFISPTVPDDIFPGGSPAAATADLEQAAIFAWQEFIALNWPAAEGVRDMPDSSLNFGDAADAVVWETARMKVEIYPGQTSATSPATPPGWVNDANQDYGYDAGPEYAYAEPVTMCTGSPSGPTPWVNLDEITQIGQNEMYAGVAGTSDFPEQLILFLAKANRQEYVYAAQPRANPSTPGASPQPELAYYYHGNTAAMTPTPIRNPAYATAVANAKSNLTVADPANYAQPTINFPAGTLEFKAAWRRLTNEEAASGRFHIARVRYYEKMDGATEACYRDSVLYDPSAGDNQDVWGLVGLHIIHKTPSAPYFIFATFGQADNILTTDGHPVEDDNGTIVNPPADATPMSPAINSTPAHFEGNTYHSQRFDPPYNTRVPTPGAPAPCTPEQRLYYVNSAGAPPPDGFGYFGTAQESICVNKRVHDIPQDVINVNYSAHQAIQEYIGAGNDSPWLHYKLVNVQWKPVDKAPGTIYTTAVDGVPPSSYYLANIVVETNNALQVFSGRFEGQPPDNTDAFNGLITDFAAQSETAGMPTPFPNTYYNGTGYNMGGCMGCHGNAQVGGTDFSFILANGAVNDPEAEKEDKFETYQGMIQDNN